MKWQIPLVTVAIGFLLLAVSCLNSDNPFPPGTDIYMGYPLFWLNTSRSLQIPPPSFEIPSKINILWVGFIIDMLLYLLPGFAVSYLIFTLNERMILLKFLISSAAAIFIGCLVASPILFGSQFPLNYLIISAFVAPLAAPVVTVIYGYYRLIRKHLSEPNKESDPRSNR